MMNWYEVQNIDTIDTPALLLYKERIKQNIDAAIKMVKDVSGLRPHVKTNKMAEVCSMMMDAGISKFKCATIAEAEMLGMIAAKDVLLAYQPVGPKAARLLALQQKYPATVFSCVVDDFTAAKKISEVFAAAGSSIHVFIDLDTGMKRTGITVSKAFALFLELQTLPGINVKGLHGYDGHIVEPDPVLRQQQSDAAFTEVEALASAIEERTNQACIIIAGGSPSFPTHVKRKVECSPGTFVFWDWGYATKFTDEPFVYAALVAARIISITGDDTVTLDLGHKSVAAENPLATRISFLNALEAVPIGQSEEHLVVKVKDSSLHTIGDVWYAVPIHICPTVALYERALVIEDNKATTEWKVIARDRKISI